jgi:hypothetical protein
MLSQALSGQIYKVRGHMVLAFFFFFDGAHDAVGQHGSVTIV